MSGHPSYFTNATGYHYYFNYLLTKEPKEFGFYGDLISKPEVRKAIHVGSLTHNNGTVVEKHLVNDMMQSVKPWIQAVMEHYK